MMRRETLTKYRNLYWNNQHTVNILETPKTWQMLFSGDLVSYEIKWSQASPVTPHQQLTLCMRERLWGALQLDIYDISNLQSSVSPPLFILLCHSPREPNAFPLPNMGAFTNSAASCSVLPTALPLVVDSVHDVEQHIVHKTKDLG